MNTFVLRFSFFVLLAWITLISGDFVHAGAPAGTVILKATKIGFDQMRFDLESSTALSLLPSQYYNSICIMFDQGKFVSGVVTLSDMQKIQIAECNSGFAEDLAKAYQDVYSVEITRYYYRIEAFPFLDCERAKREVKNSLSAHLPRDKGWVAVEIQDAQE
jgi:hypothetical protein